MKQRHMTVVAALVLAAGWLTGVPASAGELTQAEMKGLRQAVRAHVQEQSEEEDGAFVVQDEKLDKEWRLKFIRLHDEAHQLSEKAYSVCADLREVGGKRRLDVDFLVNKTDSGWIVRQVVIHNINGQPRETRAARAPSLEKQQEAAKTVYACPMGHYSSDQPGKCPKCGMDLQKAPQ